MVKKIDCSIGDKDFLSVAETLAYAGISESILTKWRDNGLNYLRDGGRVWFVKEDIKEYMLRLRVH